MFSICLKCVKLFNIAVHNYDVFRFKCVHIYYTDELYCLKLIKATKVTSYKICRFWCISVPAAGFTQRATIDPDLNEIHVLSVSYAHVIYPVYTEQNYQDCDLDHHLNQEICPV